MTYEEFNSLSIVMDAFPLTFSTGEQHWSEMAVCCNDCDERIPRDSTRGIVTPIISGYRTALKSYEIRAYGICPKCKVLSGAHVIFHDDMTMTKVEDDGSTRLIRSIPDNKSEPQSPPTRHERIRSFFKRLFSKNQK